MLAVDCHLPQADRKGTLATTTMMNDVLLNKYSGSEVLLGFGRNKQGLILKMINY